MNELEQQCMSLPRQEKERLVNVLMRSLDFNVTGKTLDEIHMAVIKFCGHIRSRSRKRDKLIGRVLFSHFACLEGYSLTVIGDYLDRDHSTVSHMKNTMKRWLEVPQFYKEENRLYGLIRKELYHETDR